jgi:hypothetical protein
VVRWRGLQAKDRRKGREREIERLIDLEKKHSYKTDALFSSSMRLGGFGWFEWMVGGENDTIDWK